MNNGLTSALGVEHVFVLMLENRSFDHMLGFSGITGKDAESGQQTAIRGTDRRGGEQLRRAIVPGLAGSRFGMATDPAHEFQDVLHQLCGMTASYQPACDYLLIDNSAFVASYVGGGGGRIPGEIMRCYTVGQLPVLSD